MEKLQSPLGIEFQYGRWISLTNNGHPISPAHIIAEMPPDKGIRAPFFQVLSRNL